MIIKNKTYTTPAFLPDATRAVVKGLPINYLSQVKIDSLMVNTFHLINTPTIEIIKKAGGIKKFMNFDGLVSSDSGGWQVYSLISKKVGNAKTAATISDDGIDLKLNMPLYSPEFCINAQFDIGSDIIICLDDYSLPNATHAQLEKTVERTIAWASRCKVEFEKQIEIRNIHEQERPMLMGVVQGGSSKLLRKQCIDALEAIGFDIYGWGGHTFDTAERDLDYETAEYLANIIPETKPKFGLGLGTPYQIAKCASFGWDLFDCTLPTRDARHARLYTFDTPPQTQVDILNKDNYKYVHILKHKYVNDFAPIDSSCDCITCQNYSKAYLHHLFKLKDSTAHLLASLHNLRVYTRVIEILRSGSNLKGKYES